MMSFKRSRDVRELELLLFGGCVDPIDRAETLASRRLGPPVQLQVVGVYKLNLETGETRVIEPEET